VPAIALALGTLAGRALADDTDAPRAAAARAIFDDAMRLADAGRHAEACPKFAESMRLDPGMGVKYRLALCYENTSRLASAWVLFTQLADESAAAKMPDREKHARAKADALRTRLCRMIVVVPADVASAPGLEIARDGEALGAALFGTSIPVDGGRHVIKVSATGKRTWETSVEIGGEGSTITVTIPTLKTEPEVGPIATTAPTGGLAGTDSAPWPVSKKLGLGAGITGAAGVIVGAIFGGLAAGALSRADAECLPEDRTQCTQKGVDLANEAKAFGTVSTAAFVAGGLLAAGGVVLFVLAPGSDAGTKKGGAGPQPAIAIGAGPASVLMRGNF
jgi:hypothetical protein